MFVVVVFTVLYPAGEENSEVSLTQFLADVQAGRVTRIEVDGRTVDYEIQGVEGSYTTELERGDTVREILAAAGVEPGSPNYPIITTGSD